MLNYNMRNLNLKNTFQSKHSLAITFVQFMLYYKKEIIATINNSTVIILRYNFAGDANDRTGKSPNTHRKN